MFSQNHASELKKSSVVGKSAEFFMSKLSHFRSSVNNIILSLIADSVLDVFSEKWIGKSEPLPVITRYPNISSLILLESLCLFHDLLEGHR
jgi:hypothetical protein